MVLMYKGQEWYFVDGGIAYTTPGRSGWSCNTEKGFFLVAIGQSAVRLLSEQGRIFRLITGSTELAVFSIYRWSQFVRTAEA